MKRKIYVIILVMVCTFLMSSCSGRPTVNIHFNKTSSHNILSKIADAVIYKTNLSFIDKTGDYVDPRDVMIWMYNFIPWNVKTVITGSYQSKPFISIYSKPNDQLTNELLNVYITQLNKLEVDFRVDVLNKDYYFSLKDKKLLKK